MSLPFDNSPWILPLKKPAGMTSYDCIREVKNDILNDLGRGKGRRKLKIGHFGTLDPFAEGVLLVGTGKALKLMEFFQVLLPKTYAGVGSLKFSTDTGDREGKVLKETNADSHLQNLKEENIQKRALEMLGDYWQKPPYFSAVKHEGRPLYEWARSGVFVDKEPVLRKIHNFSVFDFKKDEGRLSFKTQVSSGTYIRGLWVDLCSFFGVEGHLLELSRLAWGDCQVEHCFSLEETKGQGKTNLKKFLLRPDEIWKLETLELNEIESEAFKMGQFLKRSDLKPYHWVKNSAGELLGLGVPYPIQNEVRLKCEVLLCD